MTDKEAKSTTRRIVANEQADYYSWIISITVNGKNAYELKGKFLDDLHKKAFSGTNGEDAVEHIKYFLKNVDPIDLPNVNQDKLKVVVFPISLVGDAWSWKEDGYCNGGNLPGSYMVGNTLCYQDLEWYDALKDSKLKEEALRNKAIMEGMINDNDESSNNGLRRWDGYEIADYDQEEREYENEHEDEEICELFDDHELPVCTIRRFKMIKYSFRQDEIQRYQDRNACFSYILHMTSLKAKKSTKLVKYQSSGILCVIVVMLEYIRRCNVNYKRINDSVDVIIMSGGRSENQPTTTMVVVKDLEREKVREREMDGKNTLKSIPPALAGSWEQVPNHTPYNSDKVNTGWPTGKPADHHHGGGERLRERWMEVDRYGNADLGRYDVSMPALTKDHEGNKTNTPHPEEGNMPYSSHRYAVSSLMDMAYWSSEQ
nr:hypothetical protein [Tanacetum cinerariifolium]